MWLSYFDILLLDVYTQIWPDHNDSVHDFSDTEYLA